MARGAKIQPDLADHFAGETDHQIPYMKAYRRPCRPLSMNENRKIERGLFWYQTSARE